MRRKHEDSSNEICSGIVLGELREAVARVPKVTEAGIALKHRPKSPLRREISGLVMCHSHNSVIICDCKRVLFEHLHI
jgi:hypothetical protein